MDLGLVKANLNVYPGREYVQKASSHSPTQLRVNTDEQVFVVLFFFFFLRREVGKIDPSRPGIMIVKQCS